MTLISINKVLQKSNAIYSGGIFVALNDKWNEFLKNGSVLSYLSYVAEKKQKVSGSEKNNAASNSGVNNKGNKYR